MNTDSKISEVIDAESAALRLRIQNFSLTLDRLTTIQEDFIDLSQVYKQLKQDVKLIEAKIEAVDQLSQHFSTVVQERESNSDSLQAELRTKLAEVEALVQQVTHIQNAELTDQQKDAIRTLLMPFTDQITQSQDFVLGAMESKLRKYETQMRELRRDFQNFSRLGFFAIVGLSLALLITWALMSTR